VRAHIDWLSFTFSPVYDTNTEDGYERAIQAGLLYMFTPDVVSAYFAGAWRKQERARAPYTDCWSDVESGLVCFASPNLNHATIEISGQGCERLIEMGGMETVLHAAQERITRIDIACDIETKTMPMDFVALRDHERMRSNGMMNSDTGETCYIGSKQSERFARVYRYFPPHPRAHLLRVEMVFRREHAKKIASSIVASSIRSVAAEAGKAFGWAHSDWQISADHEVDLSITSPERNAGKTVSWLVRSVAPAIQRLITDGTIRDPEAFFRTYFLPQDGSMLD
jgi:DNA relaxase NicK